MNIRFREEHLRKFSCASLDFSPMHLSEAYARKSAIGERAVYGVLGVLAGLSRVNPPPGTVVSKLTAQYHSPLLLDVDYTIDVTHQGSDAVSVSVMDGSALMMRSRFQLRSGSRALVDIPCSAHGLTTSRALTAAELRPGLTFRGSYSPPRTAYLELLALLELKRELFGDALLMLLLSSSYLTGMELPGQSSLSVDLSASTTQNPPLLPFGFEMTLQAHDERFGLLRSEFKLFNGTEVCATGEIGALARPARIAPSQWFSDIPQDLAGKTAVVVGASRGLGAAMALYLVSAGCRVVGVYAQSSDDANALLQACRDRPGRLILEQGDASDLRWCLALKDRVLRNSGGLDLLICNAAPAISLMKIEEAYFQRIQSYLQRGLALVGAPLSVFLAGVAAVKGSVLLISSKAVETAPRNRPQYVALKSAAEGLIRAAAVEYSKITFWIARPGDIRTDLVSTPSGWLNAEDPDAVARRILGQVIGPSERSGLRILC